MRAISLCVLAVTIMILSSWQLATLPVPSPRSDSPQACQYQVQTGYPSCLIPDPIAFVEAVSNFTLVSALDSTVRLHLPSVVSGDTFVVIDGNQIALTATSVTDSFGDSFTLRNTVGSIADIWTGVATASGADIITVHWPVLGSATASISEYSGVTSIGATTAAISASATPSISLTLHTGSWISGGWGFIQGVGGTITISPNIGNLRTKAIDATDDYGVALVDNTASAGTGTIGIALTHQQTEYGLAVELDTATRQQSFGEIL